MPSTMGLIIRPKCIYHNYSSSWRVKIGFLGEIMSVEKMLGTTRRCKHESFNKFIVNESMITCKTIKHYQVMYSASTITTQAKRISYRKG